MVFFELAMTVLATHGMTVTSTSPRTVVVAHCTRAGGDGEAERVAEPENCKERKVVTYEYLDLASEATNDFRLQVEEQSIDVTGSMCNIKVCELLYRHMI